MARDTFQPRPRHDRALASVLDYENGRTSISTAVPVVLSNTR
jgi:hypothetical protein